MHKWHNCNQVDKMIPIFLILCCPVIILLASYLKVLLDYTRKLERDQVANAREITSKGKKSATGELPKQVEQAPGPMPWPILGNLNLLAKYSNPFVAFTDLSEKYGDAFSLTLGSTRCVVLNSVELITEALSRNGKYFGDRPDFIRFHRLFGGDRNNCKYIQNGVLHKFNGNNQYFLCLLFYK